MQKGMALLSAGLDSSVAVAIARSEGFDINLALTFDYGQRAAANEVFRAKKLSEFWSIPHRTLQVPLFLEPQSSGLLKTNSPLPNPSLNDLDNPISAQKSAQAVWVPNRNGIFLEIAAAVAEQAHVDRLIVGFNIEEAQTFPDNSQNYLEAINQALYFSTSNHVQVVSPTLSLNKTEIVRKALELEVPLHFIWSCYETGDLMCGKCESCMRLKRGLTQNEVSLNDFFAN